MKRIAIITVAVGAVLVGGGAAVVATRGGRAAQGSDAKAAKYHCAMHPTYTSDKPGDCPICGMKLVPIEGPSGASQTKTWASRTRSADPASFTKGSSSSAGNAGNVTNHLP